MGPASGGTSRRPARGRAPFEMILVYDHDRFFRNHRKQQRYLDEFEDDYGIKVVSVTEAGDPAREDHGGEGPGGSQAGLFRRFSLSGLILCGEYGGSHAHASAAAHRMVPEAGFEPAQPVGSPPFEGGVSTFPPLRHRDPDPDTSPGDPQATARAAAHLDARDGIGYY